MSDREKRRYRERKTQTQKGSHKEGNRLKEKESKGVRGLTTSMDSMHV